MKPVFTLLEMNINPVQYSQILAQMDLWIRTHEKGHYVMLANVQSVMECHKDFHYKNAAEYADLIVPDGMPLVVVGRWRGFHLKQRADGPGLMSEAMKISGEKGWRHFFYGGTPDTIEILMKRLQTQWPDVQVAGYFSPPFRPLTDEEDKAAVEQINHSKADVLWVGLGNPKQELWMREHRDCVNVPVMLGIGQAFDLLAGVKKHAPNWMSNMGLEWLYRLVKEPRRLWKRYLINNPWFIWLVLKEEISSRWRKSPRGT